MKHLLKVTEVYRVDTEAEAEQLIAAAKNDKSYEVSRYNCEAKEIKKTEETYQKVTIIKTFQSEKEPFDVITPEYIKE